MSNEYEDAWNETDQLEDKTASSDGEEEASAAAGTAKQSDLVDETAEVDSEDDLEQDATNADDPNVEVSMPAAPVRTVKTAQDVKSEAATRSEKEAAEFSKAFHDTPDVGEIRRMPDHPIENAVVPVLVAEAKK